MGDVLMHEEAVDGTPIKYLPINRVYSSTSPFFNPNGGFKKIKARRLLEPKIEVDEEEDGRKPIIVYSRRRRKKETTGGVQREEVTRRKRKRNNSEAIALRGTDGYLYSTRLRVGGDSKREITGGSKAGTSRRGCPAKDSNRLGKTKKWAELDFEGADPNAFVGLECKVFWPMEDNWYKGCVSGYNSVTTQHHV